MRSSFVPERKSFSVQNYGRADGVFRVAKAMGYAEEQVPEVAHIVQAVFNPLSTPKEYASFPDDSLTPRLSVDTSSLQDFNLSDYDGVMSSIIQNGLIVTRATNTNQIEVSQLWIEVQNTPLDTGPRFIHALNFPWNRILSDNYQRFRYVSSGFTLYSNTQTGGNFPLQGQITSALAYQYWDFRTATPSSMAGVCISAADYMTNKLHEGQVGVISPSGQLNFTAFSTNAVEAISDFYSYNFFKSPTGSSPEFNLPATPAYITDYLFTANAGQNGLPWGLTGRTTVNVQGQLLQAYTGGTVMPIGYINWVYFEDAAMVNAYSPIYFNCVYSGTGGPDPNSYNFYGNGYVETQGGPIEQINVFLQFYGSADENYNNVIADVTVSNNCFAHVQQNVPLSTTILNKCAQQDITYNMRLLYEAQTTTKISQEVTIRRGFSAPGADMHLLQLLLHTMNDVGLRTYYNRKTYDKMVEDGFFKHLSVREAAIGSAAGFTKVFKKIMNPIGKIAKHVVKHAGEILPVKDLVPDLYTLIQDQIVPTTYARAGSASIGEASTDPEFDDAIDVWTTNFVAALTYCAEEVYFNFPIGVGFAADRKVDLDLKEPKRTEPRVIGKPLIPGSKGVRPSKDEMKKFIINKKFVGGKWVVMECNPMTCEHVPNCWKPVVKIRSPKPDPVITSPIGDASGQQEDIPEEEDIYDPEQGGGDNDPEEEAKQAVEEETPVVEVKVKKPKPPADPFSSAFQQAPYEEADYTPVIAAKQSNVVYVDSQKNWHEPLTQYGRYCRTRLDAMARAIDYSSSFFYSVGAMVLEGKGALYILAVSAKPFQYHYTFEDGAIERAVAIGKYQAYATTTKTGAKYNINVDTNFVAHTDVAKWANSIINGLSGLPQSFYVTSILPVPVVGPSLGMALFAAIRGWAPTAILTGAINPMASDIEGLGTVFGPVRNVAIKAETKTLFEGLFGYKPIFISCTADQAAGMITERDINNGASLCDVKAIYNVFTCTAVKFIVVEHTNNLFLQRISKVTVQASDEDRQKVRKMAAQTLRMIEQKSGLTAEAMENLLNMGFSAAQALYDSYLKAIGSDDYAKAQNILDGVLQYLNSRLINLGKGQLKRARQIASEEKKDILEVAMNLPAIPDPNQVPLPIDAKDGKIPLLRGLTVDYLRHASAQLKKMEQKPLAAAFDKIANRGTVSTSNRNVLQNYFQLMASKQGQTWPSGADGKPVKMTIRQFNDFMKTKKPSIKKALTIKKYLTQGKSAHSALLSLLEEEPQGGSQEVEPESPPPEEKSGTKGKSKVTPLQTSAQIVPPQSKGKPKGSSKKES